MRLQLSLSPNTESVPFNHLHQLTGALHKWLGPNDLHNVQSLYSFGWLRGGESHAGSLRFPEGATWTISFFNDDKARLVLAGILNGPDWAHGMQVYEIREVDPPYFQQQHRFMTDDSVIVLRQKRTDGSRAYLLWDDPVADKALTQSFRRKLTAAGFTGEDLNTIVTFDRAYENARTRKITIKGIHHRGSECPVFVSGTPNALHFAWTAGIGELTGSGFGALR